MARFQMIAYALSVLLAPAPTIAQTSSPPAMQHAFPQTLGAWAEGAQLFAGLGDFHRPADTTSHEAQAYFDQGMRFLWAFNHDEATRSFARASMIDPRCAMCLWGVALTLGPNYNLPMMAEVRARVGWQAIQRAQAFAAGVPAVDRALIAALMKRFDGPKALDPSNGGPPLTAYANAMREVAHRFSDDLDVQVMFAESLMNLNPWKLWNADGTPALGTQEIVNTLEGVLAKAPQHPGANHYYIHAVEASDDPGRAIPSAERVATAMPAAGHLVHMPSHIMQRVGRYADSAEANRRADQADTAYYSRTAAIDYYPMYSAHNLQFLAAAASMEGREAETLASLRRVRALMPDDMVAGMPGIDWSVAALYEAMIRFGRWDEILAEPAPDKRLTGMTVSYRAARAQALAAKGRVADARSELASARQAIGTAPANTVAGMNAAGPLYQIAVLRAEARVALVSGDRAGAVAALSGAVRLEDGISYDEPADEFFPTRHLLGAALLDAGQAKAAEAVYREDLKRNPANGWALKGLSLALEGQARMADAAAARSQFERAWANSDVSILTSAF